MSVDHVARIRSALANTSPPRLAAGDALVSLDALVVGMEFTERRYEELRQRMAAQPIPDVLRRERDDAVYEASRLRRAVREASAALAAVVEE